MQDMIAQIVDMDQKAQSITEEAQREKVKTEQEMVQKREQIREEYLSRARKRIKINEVTERKNAQEQMDSAKQRFDAVAKELDQLYTEKGDQWVSDLVNRVIGA